MYRPFRALALLFPVALSLALVVVVAQSVPLLFTGFVRQPDGRPIAGAHVVALVGGVVCSEAMSDADGGYELPFPDSAVSPERCWSAGIPVALYVDDGFITTTTIGPSGQTTALDLIPGVGAVPAKSTPKPSALTPEVTFSGAPAVGANSVAVVGGPMTAQQLQAAVDVALAAPQSGLKVQAIWLFSGGQWNVYVPNLIAQFSAVTPPVALFIILG